MVGFDTLEFKVMRSRRFCERKSETPPTYYDCNRFKVQFMNYGAFYDNGWLKFSGSIQKAIDGQNINCNYQAQTAYILQLCELLNVKPDVVKVTRYDIATTIETETPPNVSMRNFGELSGRVKRVVGSKIFSVYYDKYKTRQTLTNGKVEEVQSALLFYDKAAQTAQAGNLLRCEYRNLKPPQNSTLAVIFRNLPKYAAGIASELDKVQIINQNNVIMKATTKAELKNALTIYAIRAAEQNNPNFIAETIEKLKTTSGADKREFWRFKQGIETELRAQTTAADVDILERLKAAFLNV
ncbi:MAG: hypothetical protein J6Y25_04435 [Elusimicrobiaceae bacterium]|nr:hypothetical protein [Elusimicrobiaceae bacterium]